jgi:ABC-type multidrug transport system permease subunit
MSEKRINSRTYSIIALISGIPGILSIAISRTFHAGSLNYLLFLVLGVLLVAVAFVFVFFFFTIQWRWTHGQPQPRSMG